MSSPLWQVIFKKEFWEVIRDPRTRFSMFVSPLLITPLILAMIGSMTKSQTEAARKETVPVAFVGVRASPTLSDILKNPQNMHVDDLETRAEAEAEIKAKKVRAALIFPPDTEEAIKESRQVTATILLDQGKSSSQEASQRLSTLVADRSARLVALKLQENGLPQQLATPFATKEENLPGGSTSGTLLAATFLPYILTLYAIVGGVSIANDTVAGEKERGTLETLLVSPASRQEIVTGKFMAVATISMIGGICSIIGFIWPYYVPLSAFQWMGKSGLTLTPAAIVAMGLVQIPLAVLGSGLLLTVSTFARNQREAQTYLSPVILLTSVGAILSMVLKTDSPLYWAAVPITNAAMVLKQALEGSSNITFAIIACVTSVVYATAAVLFAAHAFQKESILLKASN